LLLLNDAASLEQAHGGAPAARTTLATTALSGALPAEAANEKPARTGIWTNGIPFAFSTGKTIKGP
jgi:hypothetical protein